MTDLTAITHTQHEGTNIRDRNLELFRRVNAEEATYTILKSEHYRELIRLAADGRVATVAYSEMRKIMHELFDTCPQAGDAYLKAAKKNAEEAKKDADV